MELLFCQASTKCVIERSRPGWASFVLSNPRQLPFFRLWRAAPLDKQLSERDRIAVMFCGSHKTLAFGIPLIKV